MEYYHKRLLFKFLLKHTCQNLQKISLNLNKLSVKEHNHSNHNFSKSPFKFPQIQMFSYFLTFQKRHTPFTEPGFISVCNHCGKSSWGNSELTPPWATVWPQASTQMFGWQGGENCLRMSWILFQRSWTATSCPTLMPLVLVVPSHFGKKLKLIAL